MNQVGELVLLRNRLASAAGSLGKEDENMSRIAREMDLTVNDIQNTVMRLRMQPQTTFPTVATHGPGPLPPVSQGSTAGDRG